MWKIAEADPLTPQYCPSCGSDKVSGGEPDYVFKCPDCDYSWEQFDIHGDDVDPEDNFNLTEGPIEITAGIADYENICDGCGAAGDQNNPVMVVLVASSDFEKPLCQDCQNLERDAPIVMESHKKEAVVSEYKLQCTNCGGECNEKGTYTFPGMLCPNCTDGILEYHVQEPKQSSKLAAESDSDNSEYMGDYTTDDAGDEEVTVPPVAKRAHEFKWAGDDDDDEDGPENMRDIHTQFPVEIEEPEKVEIDFNLDGFHDRKEARYPKDSLTDWGMSFDPRKSKRLREIFARGGPSKTGPNCPSCHASKTINVEGSWWECPKCGSSFRYH